MGAVDSVISVLRNQGVRVEQSFPGTKMPAITSPVVAVSLEKAEEDGQTVLAALLTPGDRGQALCEAAALELLEIVRGTGAKCSIGSFRYDGRNHLFGCELRAFFPEEEPETVLPFTVKLGAATLLCATGFKSWHLSDDPETAPLSGSVCYFRIEERMSPGAPEQNTPAEPFTMTVSRRNCTETFYDCRLTSDVREDGSEGIDRVRSGIAQRRTIVSIL